MKTIQIHKQDLLDYGLPYDYYNTGVLISDRAITTGSLIERHEIIFKWKDEKFYRCEYREDVSEVKDEQPWEYDDEVTCIEVFCTKEEHAVWKDA